jgi:hypothetical protein
MSDLDLTEAIEAARRVLGWGDTSAEMDRAIPKLAQIIAPHVERQVRDRIAAEPLDLTEARNEVMRFVPNRRIAEHLVETTAKVIRDSIAKGEAVVTGPQSDDCTCTVYVIDYSDPERYHPENLDREDDPNCPVHGTARIARGEVQP